MAPTNIEDPNALTDDEQEHIRPHIGKRLMWTSRQAVLLANEGMYRGRWSPFVETALKLKLTMQFLRRYEDLQRAHREPFIDHPEVFERNVINYASDVQDEIEASILNIDNQELLPELPFPEAPYFNGDKIAPGVDQRVLDDLPLKDLEADSPRIEMNQLAAELEKEHGRQSIREFNQLLRAWTSDDFDRRTFRQCLLQSMSKSTELEANP